MNPVITGKLRLLTEFSLFGALAGIIFELLREGLIDYRAFVMGVPIGFAFGIMELFVFFGLRRRFLNLPLLLTLFLKAFAYVLVIYFVTGIVGLIVGFFQGKLIEEWYSSLFDIDQLILTFLYIIDVPRVIFLYACNSTFRRRSVSKVFVG